MTSVAQVRVGESIGDRFLSWAEKQPDRSWCTYYAGPDDCIDVTYGELKERALQFAAAFGDGSGKRIAVCLYPSRDLHAAFLGAMLAGHAPAMMPPFSSKTEPEKLRKTIIHFLDSMAPEMVVIDDETLLRLKDASVQLPSGVGVISPSEVAARCVVPGVQRSGADIAFIQHSSGTTGLQKGVALSHRSVVRHFEAYSNAIALDQETDSVVSWLPLYHDMGLISCFIVPILAGMSIIEIPTLTWAAKPSLLFDAITKYKPTLCWLPNFAYTYLSQGLQRAMGAANWNLGSIRLWTNCSEPVTCQSQEKFLKAFEGIGCTRASLGASYAMAENVFAVTQLTNSMDALMEVSKEALARRQVLPPSGSEDIRILVSCGRPVAGVSLKILEPESESESVSAVGEIAIKSDFMFSAYWNNPDATAKAFTTDGYYRTGDSGFVSNDSVYVTGRLKDIIIIQGKNLQAGDIEELLSGIHGLIPGRVVALGLADDATGSERLAILAETELAEESERKIVVSKIRTKITSELGVAASLIRLLPPRWLIKSTSGKMARKENREKLMKVIEAKNV